MTFCGEELFMIATAMKSYLLILVMFYYIKFFIAWRVFWTARAMTCGHFSAHACRMNY